LQLHKLFLDENVYLKINRVNKGKLVNTVNNFKTATSSLISHFAGEFAKQNFVNIFYDFIINNIQQIWIINYKWWRSPL